MGLEKCRAQCLNKAAVVDFYATLGDILEKYDIPEENIYNMDEKGIQLGVRGRVLALVTKTRRVSNRLRMVTASW